ncbi:hypothetical protein SGPA1_21303 [Streptomyces misionensis JCM 4497]
MSVWARAHTVWASAHSPSRTGGRRAAHRQLPAGKGVERSGGRSLGAPPGPLERRERGLRRTAARRRRDRLGPPGARPRLRLRADHPARRAPRPRGRRAGPRPVRPDAGRGAGPRAAGGRRQRHLRPGRRAGPPLRAGRLRHGDQPLRGDVLRRPAGGVPQHRPGAAPRRAPGVRLPGRRLAQRRGGGAGLAGRRAAARRLRRSGAARHVLPGRPGPRPRRPHRGRLHQGGRGPGAGVRDLGARSRGRRGVHARHGPRPPSDGTGRRGATGPRPPRPDGPAARPRGGRRHGPVARHVLAGHGGAPGGRQVSRRSASSGREAAVTSAGRWVAGYGRGVRHSHAVRSPARDAPSTSQGCTAISRVADAGTASGQGVRVPLGGRFPAGGALRSDTADAHPPGPARPLRGRTPGTLFAPGGPGYSGAAGDAEAAAPRENRDTSGRSGRGRAYLDRLVAGVPPAHRDGSAGPGRRRQERPQRAAHAPGGLRRPGGQVGLPVLRGGLRPERVRPGREGHPDRGRPRLPRVARPVVPQGLGEPPADHRRGPPPRGALPAPARHRVGAPRPRHRDGHDRRPGDRGPPGGLGVGGRPGPHPAHPGLREPRRGHPGQRRELPDQEVVHGARRDPDREPGARLTLLHRSQSGNLVRTRRRDHLPAGPAELGLHRHRGLEHGRVPSGRVPVGDGGQGAGREGDPRRPAVHPHQRARRSARAAARGLGHRVPRRDRPVRAGARQVLPRLHPGVHQRAGDPAGGLL